MISVRHEGVEVEYNEALDQWVANDEGIGLTFRDPSLAKVKKRITEHLQRRKTGRFKRQKALMETSNRWDESGERFQVVEVTSLIGDGQSYREGWISRKDRNGRLDRQKVELGSLYEVTEQNQERAKKFAELARSIHSAEREQARIKQSMTRFVPELPEKKAEPLPP